MGGLTPPVKNLFRTLNSSQFNPCRCQEDRSILFIYANRFKGKFLRERDGRRFFFNEMHFMSVYEGESKMAVVLSFKSLMRCKRSWVYEGS